MSDDARAALPERLRPLNTYRDWLALPLEPALEALEFFEHHENDWRPEWVEPFALSPDGEFAEHLPWIVATWGNRGAPIPGSRIPKAAPEAYAFVRAAIEGWGRRWAARSANEYLGLPPAEREQLERHRLWPLLWARIQEEQELCRRLRASGLQLYFDMDFWLARPRKMGKRSRRSPWKRRIGG
jgi:hypothetical protein